MEFTSASDGVERHLAGVAREQRDNIGIPNRDPKNENTKAISLGKKDIDSDIEAGLCDDRRSDNPATGDADKDNDKEGDGVRERERNTSWDGGLDADVLHKIVGIRLSQPEASIEVQQGSEEKIATEDVEISQSNNATVKQLLAKEPLCEARSRENELVNPRPESASGLPRGERSSEAQTGPGAYALGGPSEATTTTTTANTTLPAEEGTSSHNLQSDSHSGLAVAAPVDDHPEQDLGIEIPQAREHDGEISQNRKRRPHTGIVMAILIGSVVLAAVIVLIIFLRRNRKFPTSTDSPTTSPTVQTTALFIQRLLPEFTLNSLQDANSTQSLAFRWLLDDPEVDTYTPARILQRFALATLYYSSGGATWINNDGWLNYSLHECDWSTGSAYALKSFRTADLAIFFDDVEPYSALSFPCETTALGNETYHHLWLNQNELSGDIPQELFLLTDLKSIGLGLNQELRGTISSLIGLLTNLEALGLVGVDGLKGTIPSQVGSLSKLQELELVAQLEGSLPTQLGLHSNLRVFSLERNFLTGHLPTEFGNLDQLIYFRFSDNTNLTGSIPTQFGQLSALRLLEVYGGELTGILPTQLGMAQALQGLELAKNFLITGTIPSELGLLTNMKTLFALYETSLTGTIPTELGPYRAHS